MKTDALFERIKALDPKIDDIKAMLIESTCRSNNILAAMHVF